MNAVELRELNDVLENECGWRVEIGVSPVSGEEFFCVYEALPDERRACGAQVDAERLKLSFVGVMPICSTLGAFVSSAALCQYYYQKGRSEFHRSASEFLG